MRELLRTPITPVWLILVASTVGTYLLGIEEGEDRTLTAMIIMGLAAVKIALVGAYFMDIRHAPLPLKAALYGWIVLTFGVMAIVYLATT